MSLLDQRLTHTEDQVSAILASGRGLAQSFAEPSSAPGPTHVNVSGPGTWDEGSVANRSTMATAPSSASSFLDEEEGDEDEEADVDIVEVEAEAEEEDKIEISTRPDARSFEDVRDMYMSKLKEWNERIAADPL